MAVRSDVCLILEGTYPYVAGGVSSWVHQLLNAFTDLRFSLLTILPTANYGAEAKYPIPPNVTEMSSVLIHNYEIPKSTNGPGDKRLGYDILRQFVEGALEEDYSLFSDLIETIRGSQAALSPEEILFSEETWELINDLYKEHKLDVSFIDFFWTFRFSMLSLLRTLTAKIPKAKIYHSISTGYAGILGSISSLQNTDAAYIVTEHGIYSKERKIEIADARWIYDETADLLRPQPRQSFLKQWWIALFKMMSQITYQHADEIITLYEGNRRLQIQDGAPPEKCKIIPNGININLYQSISNAKPPSKKDKIIVSLVGRVVPIKDIKTFINAAKIICENHSRVEIWICGSMDEDPEYYGDCLVLRNLLGLEDRVIFQGKVDLSKWYPKMDVVVLTSISEAQPLVILEANCCGIPFVASNVGSCSELINGRTEDDQALGPSGLITGVANPQATAAAILKIVNNDDLYMEMSRAGQERVKRYYQEEDLFASYLELYEQYL